MTVPSLVTRDVVPILQVAVGPVILISGIGLLLLSMTNRFGRLIDRSRQLAHELRTAGEDERVGLVAQVRILTARAQIVRLAIALATTSILLASLLIILLFLTALLGMDVAVLLSLVFIACMALPDRVARPLPPGHQLLAARLHAGDRGRRPPPPLTAVSRPENLRLTYAIPGPSFRGCRRCPSFRLKSPRSSRRGPTSPSRERGSRRPATLPTRVPSLDRLLGGGLPRGSLVEICRRASPSCGLFSAALSALAAATQSGEAAALVDPGDHFDPQGAADSGVDLPASSGCARAG